MDTRQQVAAVPKVAAPLVDTRTFGKALTVAISAQAISCSNVHGVFPVHELFWFCLVHLSATQFCSFQSLLMSCAGDGTDVPRNPIRSRFESK